MIRSCVVKKVTASHHGSSSTEINATTIMMPATGVKKATASHDIVFGGSSSTEIDATFRMMPCTVAKKATVSHAIVIGTNRSTDDIESKDGVESNRGFQHRYKSTTTNSSRRVNEAYNATARNGAPKSKNAIRRDKAKTRKIAGLTEVVSSSVHALGRAFLSTRPVFYSGTKNRKLPNPIPNGIMLSAVEDLRVIDTISGARMLSSTGDTVFILIPRHDAIKDNTFVKKTLMALHALDKGKRAAEVRGKSRITVAEDDGKYTTVGLKPRRGSTGVSEFWPKKLGETERHVIRKLMSRCQEVAKGYLPSTEVRGLLFAQLLGGWRQISGVTSNPLWGSLACGKNYYLNSHVDEDFFYSLTTVASERGVQDNDRYMMEANICNYFTFAEQGIAVALRPGDMLIFNPLYHHCLSSRTAWYENDDVFCLSLYLKTAVVGQNDNRLPM
jgi:hypothetical protein